MDPGFVGIAVAIIAAIPGFFAYRATRRAADTDLFVRRDETSWRRMLDSMARSDLELANLRKDFDGQAKELEHWRGHAMKCDAALAKAEQRLTVLEAVAKQHGDL